MDLGKKGQEGSPDGVASQRSPKNSPRHRKKLPKGQLFQSRGKACGSREEGCRGDGEAAGAGRWGSGLSHTTAARDTAGHG